MIEGICPNRNCVYGNNVAFEIDDENRFCAACGVRLQPAAAHITLSDLVDVLTRYEGAVSACERDGDDSDEAVTEMTDARAQLLDLLRQAKVKLP